MRLQLCSIPTTVLVIGTRYLRPYLSDLSIDSSLSCNAEFVLFVIQESLQYANIVIQSLFPLAKIEVSLRNHIVPILFPLGLSFHTIA